MTQQGIRQEVHEVGIGERATCVPIPNGDLSVTSLGYGQNSIKFTVDGEEHIYDEASPDPNWTSNYIGNGYVNVESDLGVWHDIKCKNDAKTSPYDYLPPTSNGPVPITQECGTSTKVQRETAGTFGINEHSDTISRIQKPINVEKYMLNISDGNPNQEMAEIRADNVLEPPFAESVVTLSATNGSTTLSKPTSVIMRRSSSTPSAGNYLDMPLTGDRPTSPRNKPPQLMKTTYSLDLSNSKGGGPPARRRSIRKLERQRAYQDNVAEDCYDDCRANNDNELLVIKQNSYDEKGKPSFSPAKMALTDSRDGKDKKDLTDKSLFKSKTVVHLGSSFDGMDDVISVPDNIGLVEDKNSNCWVMCCGFLVHIICIQCLYRRVDVR